jgi:hypothetical protein
VSNLTGFGIPSAVNTGCSFTTFASFTGGTSNCAAINQQLEEVTVGFWQDFYKGNYGRVAGGFEWEFIRRTSFPGVGGTLATCCAPGANAGSIGTVSTSDNVFLTSLRYYPF